MASTRTKFHLAWAVPAGVSMAVGIGIYALAPDNLAQFYGDEIRGSLFSGFLSAGGFLLALKTFILIKMKQEVYDTDLYGKNFENARKRNQTTDERYGPLKRLGQYLFLSIMSAFTTAALQLTVGLLGCRLTATVCLTVAMFTTILLVVCLLSVKSNLNEWFRLLDQAQSKQTET